MLQAHDYEVRSTGQGPEDEATNSSQREVDSIQMHSLVHGQRFHMALSSQLSDLF